MTLQELDTHWRTVRKKGYPDSKRKWRTVRKKGYSESPLSRRRRQDALRKLKDASLLHSGHVHSVCPGKFGFIMIYGQQIFFHHTQAPHDLEVGSTVQFQITPDPHDPKKWTAMNITKLILK